VRLGGGTVSAQDVADLEVGDILMLDHASDRPVEAYLNDRLMFVGAPGAADDRMHYTVTARAGDL
jgi:flagellar motor switch protein FliM